MFIETVECPQFAFNKRRFLLDLDEDIEAIAAGPAEYVVVNTFLGKSGASAEASSENRERAREIDELKLRKAAETLNRSTSTVKSGFADFIAGEQADLSGLGPVSRELKERMAEGPAILLEMTRLKTKDEGTFVHSIAVGALMSSLGEILGYDDAVVETLGVAGILHDCGKLLIPNTILNKPGTLTDVERQIVRNHPELGFERLMTHANIPELVLDVCRYHHEMLDGSGYPHGLRAEQLSPFVRLSTVCDVFDALTSVRPYKKAWTGKQAVAWMFEQGERFDRKMVLRLGEITVSD